MSNHPAPHADILATLADSVMRLPAVRVATGRCRSSIYADKSFPKAIKLGPRAVGWLRSDVEAWIAARVAERDAAQ